MDGTHPTTSGGLGCVGGGFSACHRPGEHGDSDKARSLAPCVHQSRWHPSDHIRRIRLRRRWVLGMSQTGRAWGPASRTTNPAGEFPARPAARARNLPVRFAAWQASRTTNPELRFCGFVLIVLMWDRELWNAAKHRGTYGEHRQSKGNERELGRILALLLKRVPLPCVSLCAPFPFYPRPARIPPAPRKSAQLGWCFEPFSGARKSAQLSQFLNSKKLNNFLSTRIGELEPISGPRKTAQNTIRPEPISVPRKSAQLG